MAPSDADRHPANPGRLWGVQPRLGGGDRGQYPGCGRWVGHPPPGGEVAWIWPVRRSDQSATCPTASTGGSVGSSVIESLNGIASSPGLSAISATVNSTAATSWARLTVAMDAPGTGAPRKCFDCQ